jgi:hypothetical protein
MKGVLSKERRIRSFSKKQFLSSLRVRTRFYVEL